MGSVSKHVDPSPRLTSCVALSKSPAFFVSSVIWVGDTHLTGMKRIKVKALCLMLTTPPSLFHPSSGSFLRPQMCPLCSPPSLQVLHDLPLHSKSLSWPFKSDLGTVPL